MRASRHFLFMMVAAWGAALVYGCAVGGEDEATDDCVIGSETCECTIGGGCDPPLECLSGFCVDTGAMGGNTNAPSGNGGSSAGGALNVASSGPGATTTTGSGPSTTSGTSTTSTTTSTTTGGSCALAEPTNVTWCTSGCDACGSWPITWDAVAGATHYRVRWSCSITPEKVSADIFGTSVDFANSTEVDAGGLGCGFAVHSVYVMACDGTCCTNGALVPTMSLPPACGGGCCA